MGGREKERRGGREKVRKRDRGRRETGVKERVEATEREGDRSGKERESQGRGRNPVWAKSRVGAIPCSP